MKLGEKIQYYRKHKKLSQEERAARVGVSSQAVCKWELGDATPEVDKLVALAKAFGVTTDELLSSEEPEVETPPPSRSGPHDYRRRGFEGLSWFIHRYGWLAGVYIALSGAGIALVGGLARFAFGRMFQVTIGDYFDNTGWEVMLPEQTMGMSMGVSSMGEVFLIFATVILVVGIVLMVVGSVLAAVLYRNGRIGD